uniref:Dehydrogenase/reductase (SDR family) member 13b.1 n=1 Tax=Oncorhynchus kisutch TaxID=8019 RepID=A0A8C7G233_ONCKI
MAAFLLVAGVVLVAYMIFHNVFVKGAIWKMTVLDLPRRGGRVILASRSKRRAETALESGNNEVVFMQLDLGSQVYSLLCIYIQGNTEDCLGMMFGVNHIGNFLLTNLLQVSLKECSPSRVVNVASLGHNFGKILKDTNVTYFSLHPGQYTVLLMLLKVISMLFFKNTIQLVFVSKSFETDTNINFHSLLHQFV